MRDDEYYVVGRNVPPYQHCTSTIRLTSVIAAPMEPPSSFLMSESLSAWKNWKAVLALATEGAMVDSVLSCYVGACLCRGLRTLDLLPVPWDGRQRRDTEEDTPPPTRPKPRDESRSFDETCELKRGIEFRRGQSKSRTRIICGPASLSAGSYLVVIFVRPAGQR